MNKAISRFRRSYIASLTLLAVCTVAGATRVAAYQGISGVAGVIPILILLAIALVPVIPEGGIAYRFKLATGLAFFTTFAFGCGLLVGLVECGIIGSRKVRSGGEPSLTEIFLLVYVSVFFVPWLLTATFGAWALLKNPKPNK
jgi:hypothetical protein